MRGKLKKSNSIQFEPHFTNEFKRGISITIQVFLCAILISIAFVLSCCGFYVKPIILIPIAICLAVFSEDELKSALIGMLCGILLDISYDKLFGFNGVIFLVVCVFTTIMFKNYFKPMFFNALISVSLFTFCHGLLDYFFYYKIWALNSNDNTILIYSNYIFPSCLMTIGSIIIVYPIVKSIRKNIDFK